MYLVIKVLVLLTWPELDYRMQHTVDTPVAANILPTPLK